MTFIARIRRVADGVERNCPHDSVDEFAAEFIWTDGNYGCDCNREILFALAAGEPNPIDETECGEGRYDLVSLTDETGRSIL